MRTPHKHRDVIIAWASGEEIELFISDRGYWESIESPAWTPHFQYRIKPRTILINGIEVPEPFRGELHLDQDYFVVKLHRSKKADPFVNGNPELGMRHVATGLVHLTEEAAEIHARALLSFTAKDE